MDGIEAGPLALLGSRLLAAAGAIDVRFPRPGGGRVDRRLLPGGG